MPEYIPYQVTKTAAAGQAFRATPGAVSYAPNNLGVATRQGLPKFSRGAELERMYSGITLLQYPQDVADDPQMGHYIIFEVSKVDRGAIERAAASDKNRIKEFKDKIKKQMKAEDAGYGMDDDIPTKEGLRKIAVDALLATNQLVGYKTPRELNKFMSSGGGAASKDTSSLQASSPKKKYINVYCSL